MIGHQLTNTNESTTVAKTKKNLRTKHTLNVAKTRAKHTLNLAKQEQILFQQLSSVFLALAP
jgi:hypothetical protein